MPKVGTVLARSKKKWRSARAAWADIGQKTGIHPVAQFKLRRMDSRTHYRWKYLGQK